MPDINNNMIIPENTSSKLVTLSVTLKENDQSFSLNKDNSNVNGIENTAIENQIYPDLEEDSEDSSEDVKEDIKKEEEIIVNLELENDSFKNRINNLKSEDSEDSSDDIKEEGEEDVKKDDKEDDKEEGECECEEVCKNKEESQENKLEFNRANVEAQGNHVHLVDNDEDNNLDMFCFVKCSEDDNDLLKQCRGVVFNGDKLVMKAFPFTYEYNHTETDKIEKSLKNFEDWHFYDSQEGTLIRLFYFKNKYYVSTHRKLNAFRSKWASRESFGTSFKNALLAEEEENKDFRESLPDGDNILDRFQQTLDKNKQYMFLIRNTNENRIVCTTPEKPKVYHVGTFIDGELSLTENINISPPQRRKFKNCEELLNYVKSLSYRELQGIICFNLNNTQIKILHKDYQDLFMARGNEPSIKFRYLQVRMKRRLTNMLYHLYPDMSTIFDEYENTLYDISRSIYRAYVQRFIKKRYVTVPREEFAVIRECHSWHLANRTENRISLHKIITVMNEQSPTHLNHMIRRFKLEQNRQQLDPNTRPRSDSLKSFEQSPAVEKSSGGTLSPLLLSQKPSFPNPPRLRNTSKFLLRKVSSNERKEE